MINSILATGISGVQNGIERADDAAQRIAQTGTTNSSIPNELNSLTDALVDLKVGENQVKASAAVVKTADEILGTIIDTVA